jgi:hypothetical protein
MSIGKFCTEPGNFTNQSKSIIAEKREMHLKLRRRSMRKIVATLILSCLLLVGCESLRFAPTETQKQNAWLHNRTTTIAADTAKTQGASGKLQALTRLSKLQSGACISYYGLPKELPQADTAEEVLAESNFQLAQTALAESAERPDAWQVADNVFELAIGISALLGGVYGTRAVRFLKGARTRSKALQEIITGNELFKSQHTDQAGAFKKAHQKQSPQTRQLVAQMKP